MRNSNTLATIAIAIFCASCASRDSGPPDYGSYPDNYEQLIKSHLDHNLKDPDSLKRLNIGPPVEGHYWAGLVNGGNFYGYRSCVSYNAKNSFGGYVGQKTYVYWIKHGRVTGVFPNAGLCP